MIIERGDATEHRDELIESFRLYLNPGYDEKRFDWLYRKRDWGESILWICRDEDRIVGSGAAFPRQFHVKGGLVSGYVLGDFWIHEKFRSLGPALRLQRACMQDVAAGVVSFCYDFPSQTMMAIYRRLGIQARFRMVRLVMPLRLDRWVIKAVPWAGLARRISAIANSLLSLHRRRRKEHEDLRFYLHAGPCGEEFTALAERVGGHSGICNHRSADYLNWRYFANPTGSFEILDARQAGDLIAYAVLATCAEEVVIEDLFGPPDDGVISDLVQSVVRTAAGRGVHLLRAHVADSHPWHEILRRQGFSERGFGPVVFFPVAGPAAAAGLNRWLLMNSDRDS